MGGARSCLIAVLELPTYSLPSNLLLCRLPPAPQLLHALLRNQALEVTPDAPGAATMESDHDRRPSVGLEGVAVQLTTSLCGHEHSSTLPTQIAQKKELVTTQKIGLRIVRQTVHEQRPSAGDKVLTRPYHQRRRLHL